MTADPRSAEPSDDALTGVPAGGATPGDDWLDDVMRDLLKSVSLAEGRNTYADGFRSGVIAMYGKVRALTAVSSAEPSDDALVDAYVTAAFGESAPDYVGAFVGYRDTLLRGLRAVRALTGGGPGEASAETIPNPLDILALARIAAKRHHYALTVHGSLARDLDLVAVPWKEGASEPAVLVEAIRAAVGGWIFVAEPDGRDGYFGINDVSKHSPVQRPHGRLAWSIYGVLGGAYLDLSVMPLFLTGPTPAASATEREP